MTASSYVEVSKRELLRKKKKKKCSVCSGCGSGGDVSPGRVFFNNRNIVLICGIIIIIIVFYSTIPLGGGAVCATADRPSTGWKRT